MTYGEIIDTLNAYTRKKQEKLKERAIMDYRLADLIGCNVAAVLSKDVRIPAITEAYEFLFQEEKQKQDEIKAKKDMEIWKQKMLDFTANHNRKWGD